LFHELHDMTGKGAEQAFSDRLQTCEGIERVHSLLGCGSFSYVFCCSTSDEANPVAVKVLKTKDFLPGRGREAHFIQGLRHENLVNLLKIVEGDLDYFVLELCSGGSLQDILHTANSTWNDVPLLQRIRAGHDVALALQFLHSQDILHRDVKSGNVFLQTPLVVGENLPTVKLGDLGFARPMSDYDSMTQGVGTMRYMAPEVINSGDYGTKADVFSLGILIHEMLTGLIPFGSRNEASICLAIMDGVRPDLGEVPAAVSEAESGHLLAALEAAWIQDPDDRDAAAETVEKLAGILR